MNSKLLWRFPYEQHHDERPALAAGTWAIDASHSTVGFTARHLMVSKVRGRFTGFSGKLVVNEDGTAFAEAEIDVTTITTDNEQRDGHLKTADFFHAEEFPTATFKSTGARVVDGTSPSTAS